MELLHRRQFLQRAATAAALPTVSRMARAQTYPTRPLRWIVPFPPGGPTDVIARLMGQWLSERCGQPVIIDNRPGASGNIGTEFVSKAVPDGYTLLHIAVPHAMSAALYERLNFNFQRDIAPVASFLRVPAVMVLNPSVPANSVPEFVAHAKANPGKLNMGSSGIATPQHVYGELFKMLTGVDLFHVPYRGGAAALTDLLSG
jgi:tripartite-type tricarboxylate transporter receptor subunit TctC